MEEDAVAKPNELRRPRRERARHKDVIFGAVSERIEVLRTDIEALADLVDELRRSHKKDTES
jgi:hypothetical protein